MKQFLILFAFIAVAISLCSQVPQGISYQTVVRDGNGQLLANQIVTFRFSVIVGSPSGNIVYRETHVDTTTTLGLVSLILGQGNAITGTFGAINWGGNHHYLSVEIDPNGGSVFQYMGTSQLMSVPYALSAGSTSTSIAQLTDVSIAGLVDGQVLQWSVSQGKWIPAMHVDRDEQNLQLNGNTLSITGGNSVTLPSSGSSGWGLQGNTGTSPTSNFIGTIDSVDIVIGTDSSEGMRLTADGRLFIGSKDNAMSQRRVSIKQRDFTELAWTVSSEVTSAGGFLFARQTANNDYTIGIGTEGDGILRLNPGFGTNAKTLFESGFPNIPTLVEISGKVKITGGNPASGRILTSDADGLASWRNPTFNIGNASGRRGSAPTTWTNWSFAGYSTVGLITVEVLFLNFYSATARTLYLRQPGIPDQDAWIVVDIPANRTVSVAVETINGEIEWYSSSTAAISWTLIGVGR